MSRYSKEYATGPKAQVRKDLTEFIRKIESGEIKIRGNEPKMSLRVLRSLTVSTDDTFKDLVEKYVKGELTIEQFKNKGRTRIETTIPKPLRRIETDRIHHGTPLEFGAILEDMPDEELFKFLQGKESEGVFFGDSKENTKGGSFDEREHTGARPKASKSKTVYPNEIGEPGATQFSAHPRGTRDTFFAIPDRPTTAEEANRVAKPLLEQNVKDQDLGRQVASPRRTWINQQLVDAGLIDKGVDIFSSDIDDATLKKVAPFLKSPDIQRGAAEAFKTPLRVEGGVVHYNSVDPIAAAMDPLMKNRIGALTGILFEGYNMDTIKKLEQGDVEGAATDVATGAVAGAVIEQGAKKLGAQRALGAIAAPVTGAALIAEGREGSTTDYLAKTYGPKVGMNQERPFWGTEFGEMNTEKPGYVQAAEDFIDYAGNQTMKMVNGALRLVLRDDSEL